MLSSLKLLVHINTTMKFNGYIFFLKKLPLIKKLFRNTKYEHFTAKKRFTVAAILYSILHTVINSAFFMFLGIIGPLLLVQAKEGVTDVTFIFNYLLVLLFWLLPACNMRILDVDQRKIICVKVMKMDAKKYILADYFPGEIVRLLFELPAYFLISKWFGLFYPLILFLVVSRHFMLIFFEALFVRYYEKTGKSLAKQYYLILIYGTVILLLAYILALQNAVLQIPNQIMLGIAIISIGLGLYGVRYVLNYKNYSAAVNECNTILDYKVDRTKANAQGNFRTVAMKEKDFTNRDLRTGEFDELKGYDYLNAIFHKRHRRILYQPILIQVIIIGIVLIISIIAMLIFNEFKNNYASGMKAHFPYIIFVLYMMSTGPKATKAMFYNCDISLLHYGFYHDRPSLLQTFTIRLKYLTGANLIPASLIGASILILAFIAGDRILDLVPIAFLALIMAMFFSVHHLFLYYIFQPYTSDLEMKNPFFSIFNFVTYILCYGCIQIKSAPENFLFYTVLGTILYMIIALILVYKLADKTFRFR